MLTPEVRTTYGDGGYANGESMDMRLHFRYMPALKSNQEATTAGADGVAYIAGELEDISMSEVVYMSDAYESNRELTTESPVMQKGY